ncbi:ferrous iron transport protein B [bacterium]|nr:ferrous iron transport protein B [bacterium]
MAFIGQPNCGKSTLFNEVAGYRSVSSNFPGATVSYTEGQVRILGRTIQLVDLPGIYSLTPMDPAGRETQRFLLDRGADVLVNVMDASVLSRSLELTLQLLELDIPVVLCLNMMDEAVRKGIRIDSGALSRLLGVPVVETVATRGKGIRALFGEALKVRKRQSTGRPLSRSLDVERVIADLESDLRERKFSPLPVSDRLMAVKLLEGDPDFEGILVGRTGSLPPSVVKSRKRLERSHGKPADAVISSERHAIAMQTAESCSRMGKPSVRWQDRLDDVLLHNAWGYLFLALILGVFFISVLRFGTWLEKPMTTALENRVTAWFGTGTPDSLTSALFKSAVYGFGGGLTVVIPFLVPFLFGLSFLEDSGYLPRAAFLADTFMHRIGLHGTTLIPVLLGYGCNVPAVMATRILGSPRDRFLATVVAVLVPCSARMTVIFGLAGAALGSFAAVSVYLLNLLVVTTSGWALSRLLPEPTPGMLMEIPPFRRPRLEILLKKTWFRLKDFIVIAWPLLIAGSAVLGLMDHYGWTGTVNRVLRPLTALLDLPAALGVVLVYGLLRKELTMLMLFQVLGTQNASDAMTAVQILSFTVFVVFYLPCLGTIGAMIREIGFRRTFWVSLFCLVLSVCLAAGVRLISFLV